MKFLVKAKRGNTLIGRDRTKFLDEFRFRVYGDEADIREWDSRKLIEIKSTLKDDATDDIFKTYLFDKGDDGVVEFLKKYSFDKGSAQKEPKPEVQSEVEVQAEPKQVVFPQKKVKKYKNR